MIEGFPFFQNEDDIHTRPVEKWLRKIVCSPTKEISIHASWCLFPPEYDRYSSIPERIREDVSYHPMSKKRFSSGENLFYFFFCESVFFSDHFLFCHSVAERRNPFSLYLWERLKCISYGDFERDPFGMTKPTSSLIHEISQWDQEMSRCERFHLRHYDAYSFHEYS